MDTIKYKGTVLQGGGSLASDAVTNLVGCSTWTALDSMHSNLVADQAAPTETASPFDLQVTQEQDGGKRSKCRRRRLHNNKPSRQTQKGGSPCNSQPLDIIQPYMSPVAVPFTLATQGLDSIDYSQVNAATINNMGQPIGGFGMWDPSVTVPTGLANMTTM